MTDPSAVCRLLPFRIRDGALNMAIDEALLLAASADGSPLTLRLYGWDRPTLSLGYFQRPPAESPGEMPIVRRLTGGGAIVHDAELTYSVVWRQPADGPGAGGIPKAVADSYTFLNRALIRMLRALGVAPEPPSGAGQRDAFLCFARRSPQDVTAGGGKIVGSAQRRRDGAVLHHGSVLIGPSAVRGVPDLSVSDLLGRPVSPDEAADALIQACETDLGWIMAPGRLTIDEGHLAEGLRHHKYNHLAWGGRRRDRRAPT